MKLFKKKSAKTSLQEAETSAVDPQTQPEKMDGQKPVSAPKHWQLFIKRFAKIKPPESKPSAPEPRAKPKKKTEQKPVSAPKRWRVILVGLFILILFAGSGAGIGYAAGIQQRMVQQNQQQLVTAATHFNYGVGAMLQKNYEVARIQFEYVLKILPDFPGLNILFELCY